MRYRGGCRPPSCSSSFATPSAREPPELGSGKAGHEASRSPDGVACRPVGEREAPGSVLGPAAPARPAPCANEPGCSREMLLQERQRPAPGLVGRLLVVAGPAGVVVEGVVGALVHVDLVGLARPLQGRLVGRDAGVDPL